jgi:exosortase
MQSTVLERPLPAQLASPLRFGKILLVLAVVGFAYHYSLASLLRGLALQTPLAYLGLVPIIAVALAWYRLAIDPDRNASGLPLDYVLGRVAGVALIFAAVVLALLVPVSVRFWLARVDMLSLPLFVAGVVTLFYGMRRLWTLRFPIAFLLLAWPAAYAPVLGDLTDSLTQLTLTAASAIAVVVPFAVTGGGDLFMVNHAGGSFPIVIASACAGVNSLVGYVLVGSALGYVIKGRMLSRLTWIASGIALLWFLNLLRIELIFVIGALFGREAALDVLHPVAGLLVFNLGVVAMLAVSPRFGLYFERPPATAPSPPPLVRFPRMHTAFLAVTAGLAITLAVVNAGYARYEPLANGLGTPRLASFDVTRAASIDWESGYVATFNGGRQFFGDESSWTRFQYLSTPTSDLQSSVPLYLDTISVDDPNTLVAFGLEACYRFHGYLVEAAQPVTLANGVEGELISYHNPKLGADWSALWWEWPYEEVDGSIRYQRVVLFLSDGPRSDLSGVTEVAGDGRFARTHAFLAALGRTLVADQLAAEASDEGTT